MQKTRSISRLITIFMVLLIFLAVTSLGYLLISDKYSRFHQELSSFQTEFTFRQKSELKNQVNLAIEYIDHRLSQIESLAHRKLKQRVEESLEIATAIHQKYQPHSDAEIKQLIKTTLGAIRYDNGSGYYYILDGKGVFQLNSNLPAVEGLSLSDLENRGQLNLVSRFRKIAAGSGAGFNTYLFHKPGQPQGSKSKKITFIKRFEPYNWYFGTGTYLNSVEDDIQKQINDYLNIHRFGNNNQNYVFAIKLLDINGGNDFGIMYANANRLDLIGRHISDNTPDAKGKLYQRKVLKGLREHGQCFVSYWYKKIGDNPQPQLKTSFFKLYKKENLIVAAGAYHPDMDAVIAVYQSKLEKNISRDVRNIVLILFLTFFTLLLIIRFMSKKIQHEFQVFTNFFNRAARQNLEINHSDLSLKEFQELAATVNQMVTQRQQVEQSLRDSEKKFQALTETSPTAIYIHQHGVFVYANPAACDISGYSLDELLHLKFWELIHPDTREQVKLAGQQRESGKEITSRYEMKIITKQGELKWLDFSGAAIDFEGEPAVMGCVIDITNRKKTEQALLAEKERLAVTLSSIGDGVMATDINGKITLMNNAAKQITGWISDTAMGQDLAVVLSAISNNENESPADLLHQLEDVDQLNYRREQLNIFSRDGEEKIIAASTAPISGQADKAIGSIVVIRDITDNVRLRKEMETNQKLESIGLLAGGIAHDFNNLLTAIYGNISLAKMFPDNQEKVFYYLEKSEQSLSQAQGLTQQLLTFARGGSPVKQLVAIGPLLHEVATFSLRGSNTDIEINIVADLWFASVDTGQFSQIINNLAMNASQAMPNGGRLVIKAENVILPPAELPVEINNDQFIKITMADQGSGISPEHLSKVFDPYFTTKQTGSGLGLATVFSIIKNHNGLVNVKSEPGAGTTFTIHLPASGSGFVAKAEIEHITETNQTIAGKILVMDDEEVVRETCCELLIAMGHTVDYAANGREALDKYQQALQEQQPFDLVVMDLTIPGGIGGKEAIRMLLEIDPKAKAIVSSGYSHDDVMANFFDYGFMGVVAKPYILESFAKVIQEILSCSTTIIDID